MADPACSISRFKMRLSCKVSSLDERNSISFDAAQNANFCRLSSGGGERKGRGGGDVVRDGDMAIKRHVRNFFSPTSMLDTGYVDKYNAPSIGSVNGEVTLGSSLMQYVANRFTRGSIRGQIFALLTNQAISDRLEKSAKIKWL